MNTLQNGCTIYQFTSTVSSIAAMMSADRDDRARQIPAVRSIEVVVRNFSRK